MKSKWSKENDQHLVEAIQLGAEAKVIAHETGRTVKAIWQRLSRLGISITETQCYTIRTCKNCGKEDKVSKSDASTSKFCGQSCSATFNNLLRAKKKRACLLCSKDITVWGNKYCSSDCSMQHRKQSLIKRWLDGNYDIAVASNGNVSVPVRKYLIEQADNKCSRCQWDEVNPITGKVPLTVDHVDGNCQNGHPNNLKVLCPNCHSLTPTYGALNRGNGRSVKGMRK